MINGKIYIGSGWRGSSRLLTYWNSRVLNKNFPIYNNLKKYGHNNFILLILEDLGTTGSTTKNFMLEREQYYLDIIFTNYSNSILNIFPKADTTLRFKYTKEFKLNRSGK